MKKKAGKIIKVDAAKGAVKKKKKITRSTLLKDLKTDFVLKRHISGVLSLNLAWIMV